jgi:hypothetical protein
MSAANPLWLPLGELLVERGLLSQRQLELALAEQKRTGRRLGEVLAAYGFVSQQALASTLLEQVGFADVPVVEEQVDFGAVPQVEEDAGFADVPRVEEQVVAFAAVPQVEEPAPELHAVEDVEPEQTPTPVIVRLDGEPDHERRRWWSRRHANEQRIAELERVLKDFERRSHEIQTNIAEVRATIRELRDAN